MTQMHKLKRFLSRVIPESSIELKSLDHVTNLLEN